MIKDISGRKTYMLTAIKFSHQQLYKNGNKGAIWVFRCDCGREIKYNASWVKQGNKKSCGCVWTGLSHTKLFKVYKAMKQRCYSEKCREFKRYGARGIIICREWVIKGFMPFYNWAIANGYKEGLEIDRVQVNGNYEPNNCRWVTKIVQANNKRDTIHITHNGETLSIYDWSLKTGINRRLIKSRFKSGKTMEEIFNPIIKNKKSSQINESFLHF